MQVQQYVHDNQNETSLDLAFAYNNGVFPLKN
jgi:hypothetical protein